MLKPLTRQQRTVAHLIGRGLSYRAIGEKLGISHRVVEAYVYRISDRIDAEVPYDMIPYRRVQCWAVLHAAELAPHHSHATAEKSATA